MNTFKVTNKTIDKLKYDLVREGLIDYNSLVEAVEKSEKMGVSLSQIFIRDNIIPEGTLIKFLENKLHIPYVNLEDYKLDPQCLHLIKESDVRKFKIIPLFKIEDTLTVAMADPLDFFALNNIVIASSYKIEPVICSESSILSTIDKCYGKHESPIHRTPPPIEELMITDAYDWRSEINMESNNEAQISKIIKGIIHQAILEQASDIHIDPHQTDILIKFRIDGVLYDKGSLPILMLPGLTANLKSRIGINTNVSLTPQSGRLELLIDKKNISARVATFPTNYGEKITLKIFSKAPSIDHIGMEPHDLALFKSAFTRKGGIVFASGHIGSGQQTTFYSLFKHFADGKKNIITLENPIRYALDNVNQSQVNIMVGYTYENALQYITLQEPDIIYIENMSSKEVLYKIFDLAVSGKTVFSSMFANNVIESLFKLMELGIKTEAIIANVDLIFSQKLIRTLCSHCKKETKPDPTILKKYNLSENIKYFKPVGCPHCHNIGFKGREAVFEILELTQNIKNALRQHVTEKSLLEAARKNGMITMKQNALAKLQKGVTTMGELKEIFDEYMLQTTISL